MKFSILKEHLATALSVVTSIASKNLTLPILQNVRIAAQQGSLEFSTTNLEIGVRFSVRGKVDDGGEITVPARVFLEIVNTLPNERIDCWTDGATLHITCANAKTSLRGVLAEEFPVIPTVSSGVEVICALKELVDALGQVLFSVASDESRPEIHGIFVRAEESTITLASTDSFRLSERHVALVSTVSQTQTRIIPQRTFQELERLAGHVGDETVLKMVFGENQCAIQCGGGEIISRLIEGRYPEYSQVIPQQTTTTTTVSTKEFVGLVRGASLFCRSGMNDVHCEFSSSKQELRVKAANTQVGEYDAAISAQVVGSDNSITLNFRFLLDGLNATKSDMVKFEMTQQNNPVLLRGVDAKRQYLHLIMPIKQ
ncbi:DNA polymerase III subunit beta [Candidatus Uhrbacteria bacterium]|nr:DNA polymerase III subunit beta [Candidatus Uhrbacteria bacterium]